VKKRVRFLFAAGKRQQKRGAWELVALCVPVSSLVLVCAAFRSGRALCRAGGMQRPDLYFGRCNGFNFLK
jgi:hypothetical protein